VGVVSGLVTRQHCNLGPCFPKLSTADSVLIYVRILKSRSVGELSVETVAKDGDCLYRGLHRFVAVGNS
jgi:hypothetical protein